MSNSLDDKEPVEGITVMVLKVGDRENLFRQERQYDCAKRLHTIIAKAFQWLGQFELTVAILDRHFPKASQT